MIDNGKRYCDRCGKILTRDNNKCGYEICDKCNEYLEQSNKFFNFDTPMVKKNMESDV